MNKKKKPFIVDRTSNGVALQDVGTAYAIMQLQK
jgi:hypothetical protein